MRSFLRERPSKSRLWWSLINGVWATASLDRSRSGFVQYFQKWCADGSRRTEAGSGRCTAAQLLKRQHRIKPERSGREAWYGHGIRHSRDAGRACDGQSAKPGCTIRLATRGRAVLDIARAGHAGRDQAVPGEEGSLPILIARA